MRIAIVATSLPSDLLGGAEIYAAGLAAELAERHEVRVLSGAHQTAGWSFDVARIPRLETFPPGSGAVRRSIWHLRDQWLPSVHRAVRRELERFRPDVVHTHQVQGLSAAVFSGIKAAGVPHAYTAHDYNLLCVRVSLTRGQEYCGGRCLTCAPQRLIRARLAAAHLQRLIAPSDYVRDIHVAAGVAPPERAVTIRQGAASGTTRVRSAADGALRLGYIGAVAQHKGVATLLAAFADAPADWRLRIAGSGPLADAVREAAAGDDRIDFVGSVTGDAKDAFYDAVDLLVVPSEWEENAPLVTVEAAIRGLPAVVSDRGGLPETAEARIYRSRDRAALLEAVRWFADDDRLRLASERLLADGTSFAWSTHVERVEETLAAVAAGG